MGMHAAIDLRPIVRRNPVTAGMYCTASERNCQDLWIKIFCATRTSSLPARGAELVGHRELGALTAAGARSRAGRVRTSTCLGRSEPADGPLLAVRRSTPRSLPDMFAAVRV
jgi:hypothetical protein